jgi:predicted nucleic acid-binding protein
VGNGGVNSAVSDAGPLIHLREIGCLALLGVFEALHVPEAVWAEAFGQNPLATEDELTLQFVQRHEIPNDDHVSFVQASGLQELHTGETACLYLCQRLDLSTFLTDDLAAREAAQRLRLTPVGSLGVVVRAYRLGRIARDEAEQHILNLFDVSSLYVTRAVVELAIGQLRLADSQN